MDLGKELSSVPSGASYQTGTLQLMAIEVLQDKGRVSGRPMNVSQHYVRQDDYQLTSDRAIGNL